MDRRSRLGFTLVELLTVLAVLGVLLAVAAPSLADMLNRRRVEAIASTLGADLAYARSEGGLRARAITMRFASDAQTSCYVVHVQGKIGICNCLNPPGSECPGGFANQLPLKVSRFSATSGVALVPAVGSSTITFVTPHAALANEAGATVAVVGNRGYKLEARVSGLGRILVCDPDGSFGGGYKRCPSE